MEKSLDTTPSRNPLFSVLIPVFNDDQVVSEAITSILDQTIGLESLEIVVVDDGSTDSTPDVVDSFANRFPWNVTVIHQENQGVSAALNTALEAATGQFIACLGSDDYLSDDALEMVAKFFKDYGDECDLVAIPLFLTGTRSGPHWNNRSRFDETRIIDVTKQWNLTQIAGGGAFIRASALKDADLKFDRRLIVCEDLTLNTQVILRKMKYGTIAGPKYFNRRYAVGGSLVSSAHFRKENYTDVPRFAHQRILDCGRELFGGPPRYAQAVVAYELTWRFRADLSPMDPALGPQYRETLIELLRQIDVQVIMSQRCSIEVRLSMLKSREGDRLDERLERRGLTFYLDSFPVYSLEPKPAARHRPARCELHFFEVFDDEVEIQGIFRVPDIADMSFVLEAGGRQYAVDHLAPPHSTGERLTENTGTDVRFRAKVILRSGESLRAGVVLTNEDGSTSFAPVAVLTHPHTRFCGNPNVPYYRRDGRTVFRQRGNYSIERKLMSPLRLLRAELGFLRRARRAGAPWVDLRMRLALTLRQAKTKENTWLIADHKSEAGDNGEAMFRYLCSRQDKGIEPVFVLRKDAEAYPSLKRLGEVVEPDSKEYLKRFFDATVVINSAADAYMLDPLGRRRTYLNDLVRHESVYLDHGITKDDQSAWQNRWAKGFDLFVTSAAREQESVRHDSYGYRPSQVVLTGMPRFDLLASSPDKLIVFAPTWRKALSGSLDKRTGRNAASTVFAESNYAAFWQQIILHPRLNASMRDYGYRAVFALHGSHAAEAKIFKPSPRIQVSEYPHDYKALFRDGSVLVTDYSSVAFDFAYLRKPVIYVQGDREEFFRSHLYSEGYFSYEHDGFGPVVETTEALVDRLIALLETSCEMEPQYAERVNNFFAYSGGGNSERVRRAIEAKIGS